MMIPSPLRNTFFLLLFVGSTGLSCSTANKNAAPAEPLATSVDSGRWTFTVQMVRPQEGMNSQPNGTYSVIFKPGNLNVYLPYFGRAFSGAEVFQGKSALDFISKDFSIDKQQPSEGRWRIVVRPNDQRQVQTMTFQLFNNGTGSLDIIMTNRSPISYTGQVSRSRN